MLTLAHRSLLLIAHSHRYVSIYQERTLIETAESYDTFSSKLWSAPVLCFMIRHAARTVCFWQWDFISFREVIHG
jgi:hypothetical protein